MTDEERKAIELLKILNNEVLNYANKNSDNEDILSGEFYTKKDNIFMFKVLIDLIEKQDKAIDRMAGIIDSTYFEREEFEQWFENKILSKDECGLLLDYKEKYIREPIIKEYFMEDKE